MAFDPEDHESKDQVILEVGTESGSIMPVDALPVCKQAVAEQVAEVGVYWVCGSRCSCA